MSNDVTKGEPGRVCPVRYRYAPSAIAEARERRTETLYVVGGLYGNLRALDTIEAMTAAESGPTTLCFNGDFNWFNIDDAGFRAINERVLGYDAILGNVEAELGGPSSDAGCGCAYPENVDHDLVERSIQIHATLKRTAARHPELLSRLSELPMIARYRVGEVRVGVVHGDAESLAGWRVDVTALNDSEERNWRAKAFAGAEVDVFASSHTCLPAMRCFYIGGVKLVANNGAAGMPNAIGTNFGILTRIGQGSSPHPSLYGRMVRGVTIDAIPIRYDNSRWQEDFLKNWPAGDAVAQFTQHEWDVAPAISAPGRFDAVFVKTGGQGRTEMEWVELRENGKVVQRVTRPGSTDWKLCSNDYLFELPSYNPRSRYAMRASIRTAGGTDASGDIYLVPRAASSLK